MIDHTSAGDTPADGQPGGGPEVVYYLRDALGNVDGVNLYQYVASMPAFYVDPLGLTYSILCRRASRVRPHPGKSRGILR